MVEDNPDYAELVQHWLSTPGEDFGFILDWTDTLAGGLQRLARGGVDVVLLDLGLPDSEGIATFRTLHDRAEGIPIVVLSAGDDEPQALQLIQEGAENYLSKGSNDRQQLTRALRYAIVKRPKPARAGKDTSKPQAAVIGVMGAKGGAGATTVACNLSAELRRQTEKPVLLADLDLDGGLGSFLFGLEPKYFLDSVMENLDRLDRSIWDSMVTHGPLDCHFISAPPISGEIEVTAENVKEALRRLSAWYAWIVLDLGRLCKFSAGLLAVTDQLIVVTKTAVPELYQAKRTIDALGRAGIDRERIRLVLNETGRKNTLTSNELKSVFGIDVYAALPDASEELESACVKKRLPAESGAVRRKMAGVARRMAGLPETKPKGLLLSLTNRFRKPGETGEALTVAAEPGRAKP